MSRANLSDIRDIIAIALDSFDETLDSVTLDCDIYEDCGLDSMGAVAMIVEIQRRYGVRIPDNLVPELRRPSQLIEYINAG